MAPVLPSRDRVGPSAAGDGPDGVPPTSARSLWRDRDFMKLWTGQTISQLGSQVTLLALPLTAILLFKATAFQVGVLSAAEFLPFLLFGLPVGVWVDRLRRKPILIVADLGRFLVLGSVPVAYWLGVLHLWQLYAVAFLTGIGTVFFDVAYGSYLPSLIERERLVQGNSKLEISRSGAQLAGPGLAGLLVQVLKAPVAILADATSYLGSVLFLVLIRRPEPPVETPQEGHPLMRRQIGEGVRYVLGHRYLRPIAACTATLNFVSGLNAAVLLVFAVRRLGMSAGLIGAALSIGNVGFLGGAFIAERIARRMGPGPAVIGGAVLIGSAAVLIPLATPAIALPIIIAYGVIASFGGVIYNVNARSLAQSITPERMLGRTIATLRFIVWGTIPVGALLGGVLGTTIGLRPTLWIAAAGGILAFLPPLLSPVRSLRDMPSEPAPVAASPESPSPELLG